MATVSPAGPAVPLSSGQGPSAIIAGAGSPAVFNDGLQQARPTAGQLGEMASMMAMVLQMMLMFEQSGLANGAPGGMMPPPPPGVPPPGQAQPPAPQPAAPPTPVSGPAAPGASAGTGPNAINITNHEGHDITVGKFKNGESATAPSAAITLKPGESGTLRYENGEAGFAAQADSSGKYQPDASRLEYEADKDGNMKYPDVSYIDGRNSSISLTDGAGLDKGDAKSITGSAPSSLVTTDSGGNETISGWYDGSTGQMQQGGAFMQEQLGTSGAYLHPNDDTLPGNQNPMSGTRSATIDASFGNA